MMHPRADADDFFRLSDEQALWIGRDALQNRTPLCPHDQAPMAVSMGASGAGQRLVVDCHACGAWINASPDTFRPGSGTWTAGDLSTFVDALRHAVDPVCPCDSAELLVRTAHLSEHVRRYLFLCPVCLTSALVLAEDSGGSAA